MGKKTVLTPARKGSVTLRVTVPVDIVRPLKLKAGDEFEWSLKVENGKMGIDVKPVIAVKPREEDL